MLIILNYFSAMWPYLNSLQNVEFFEKRKKPSLLDEIKNVGKSIQDSIECTACETFMGIIVKDILEGRWDCLSLRVILAIMAKYLQMLRVIENSITYLVKLYPH